MKMAERFPSYFQVETQTKMAEEIGQSSSLRIFSSFFKIYFLIKKLPPCHLSAPIVMYLAELHVSMETSDRLQVEHVKQFLFVYICCLSLYDFKTQTLLLLYRVSRFTSTEGPDLSKLLPLSILVKSPFHRPSISFW
ncbi:hypothetical protein CIPAW_03G193700 [Carya illinoinensis]|uniref:Uncharacterized protein n=1 Tax=Carya illinoinensis TaxID=32201 RepID=A0A8T1R4Q3_CARIL|nr:hypothetical protein CIPAW_03G193700 [Carya illinoinensis]